MGHRAQHADRDVHHATAKAHERTARNIHPGGWLVSGGERPLSTLLGSCVAVCLHDPQLHIGGMNHFLLPARRGNIGSETEVFLAGDYAMEVLVNALMKRGARKSRLVAKAFGGSNVVGAISMAIGDSNARFATEWLAREGIPLLASDLGGKQARKVIFVPRTGEAFCRRIPNGRTSADLARAEAGYGESLVAAPAKPIDYF